MAWAKRGRPRTKVYTYDLGTPELQNKRKNKETSEALDLCLEKGYITEDQHAAGMKLRWLYSLNFGLPTLSAYDPAKEDGKYIPKAHNTLWLAEQKANYMTLLNAIKHKHLIVQKVCIYHLRPQFLTATTSHNYKRTNRELEEFKEGMEILEKTLSHIGKRPYNSIRKH